MDILMTFSAFVEARSQEDHFGLAAGGPRWVTAETRDGAMGAPERKRRLLMAREGECRRRVAIDGMTALARAPVFLPGELVVMGIAVTIRTAREMSNPERPPVALPHGGFANTRSMTRFAPDTPVLTKERVARHGMIEVPCCAFDPPVRGMTPFAGTLESSRVRVLVARGARSVGDADKLHGLRLARGGRMAFDAVHRDVTTGQRVLRLVVGKRINRRPVDLIVAACARGTELAPVRVLVASQTLPGQPEIGCLLPFVGLEKHVLRLHKFFLVAIAAADGCVLSNERKLHLVMPECPGIESFHRKVSTMVLFVAFNALPAGERAMKPGPRAHAGIDFGMAMKAVGVGNAFAEGVARRAVLNPLKRHMSRGKSTR